MSPDWGARKQQQSWGSNPGSLLQIHAARHCQGRERQRGKVWDCAFRDEPRPLLPLPLPQVFQTIFSRRSWIHEYFVNACVVAAFLQIEPIPWQGE